MPRGSARTAAFGFPRALHEGSLAVLGHATVAGMVTMGCPCGCDSRTADAPGDPDMQAADALA